MVCVLNVCVLSVHVLSVQRTQCLADGALLLQEFKRESTRVGGARGESALVDAFN